MDTVDQMYRYSPRDFVTTSTRADTVESLAGQKTEILSMGPQPESAIVTTGTPTRGSNVIDGAVRHGAAPAGSTTAHLNTVMTPPTYSTNLTAAQSTAANRWDSPLNVNMLPSSTPVSDGHLWHFDTPPDTRRVEDVATKPMKFKEGPTPAPLASLLNVDNRSQITLEQPRVTFSAPVWNSKREYSERLHSYYGTGIMSPVPSEFQLRPKVRSAEVGGDERLHNRYREAQLLTQHVVSLASNFALQRTADRKYRPINKTLTFEDEDASTEHAPSSQSRWRHRYNTSPEMESDAEVKQRREH